MKRSPSKLTVTALAIATALMLPVPVAYAIPITFVGSLTGANEVPPVPSPGTGLATVVLDSTAQTLQVNVTFSGLTSNDNAAHIHCCAPLGTNAGVATTVPAFPGFPLGVTSGSYSSVVFDLTQPERNDLSEHPHRELPGWGDQGTTGTGAGTDHALALGHHADWARVGSLEAAQVVVRNIEPEGAASRGRLIP